MGVEPFGRLDLPDAPWPADTPQGWKLHVPAMSHIAPDALAAFMPIPLRERVPLELAANRQLPSHLKASESRRQTAGKLITIGSLDGTQAVRLAQECDRATRAVLGPIIVSDRPVRRRNLVHQRYGAFQRSNVFRNDRELVAVIDDPEGQPVPDESTAWFTPSSWAVGPFVTGGAPGKDDRPSVPSGRPGNPFLLDERCAVRARGLARRWRSRTAGRPAALIPKVSACGRRPVSAGRTTPPISSRARPGWSCSSAGRLLPAATQRRGTWCAPPPSGYQRSFPPNRSGLRVCTSGALSTLSDREPASRAAICELC